MGGHAGNLTTNHHPNNTKETMTTGGTSSTSIPYFFPTNPPDQLTWNVGSQKFASAYSLSIAA